MGSVHRCNGDIVHHAADSMWAIHESDQNRIVPAYERYDIVVSIIDIHKVLMAAISLKLPDLLLSVSDECATALQLSRAEYIRRALELMNRDTRAGLRAEHLRSALSSSQTGEHANQRRIRRH